jgi:YVTN family beta-propeller protein
VANMGTFQYSLVEKREGDDERGLSFPPFAHLSREAERGAVIEGRRVPGLGDPNVPEACSVWTVDVADPSNPRIVAKTRTGVPVGDAVGGSSPAALAATTDMLFVSNSTNDSIEAYDLKTLKRRWQTLLVPDSTRKHLRGVLPFGMDVSPDGKRLYVAESGINAVAVLDPRTGRQLGRIPVGWYPAKVRVSSDNRRLYVTNAKGYGSGPNGGIGFVPGPEGASIGRLMKGTVSVIDVPDDSLLRVMTRQVLSNNGFPTLVSRPDKESPIKHVVFIAKENRTFDEVFGGLSGVNGDAGLARFGEGRTVRPDEDVVSTPPLPVIQDVTVMPNHLALARRYAISDNFYVEGDVSADGHHWLVNVYANHWVETVTAAGYGGGASFRRSKAPGRLAFFGSNASVTPEGYLEKGGLWEHLSRHGIRFRNYGEGFEFPGESEEEDMKPTGIRLPVNVPMPAPLFANTCREYPTFNMQIPDQYRADQFIREFRQNYVSGGKPLPSLIYILLPGDHGAEARPAKGYPYLESYMADNDLALGRIIEELSRSPYWKNMAVFVTEDDAQSGVDHVDAHRSVLMLISPYARRGYVSHRHSSTSSIFRTIYRLFGLPSLNLCDALASDLSDMFGDTADLAPYQALPVDKRIFDSARTRDPKDPDYSKAGRDPSLSIDTVEESIRQQKAARREAR